MTVERVLMVDYYLPDCFVHRIRANQLAPISLDVSFMTFWITSKCIPYNKRRIYDPSSQYILGILYYNRLHAQPKIMDDSCSGRTSVSGTNMCVYTVISSLRLNAVFTTFLVFFTIVSHFIGSDRLEQQQYTINFIYTFIYFYFYKFH